MWLPPILGVDFPYATLLVNLSGSFAMGIVTTLVLERALIIAPEVRLLIARQSVAEVSSVIGTVEGAIGFLGSYTTFSSYELDTIYLFRDFNWQRAMQRTSRFLKEYSYKKADGSWGSDAGKPFLP